MILGIGSDIIDCRRIEAAINRLGIRFINRIYTIAEQERIDQRLHKAASYAKLFAAKEATVKALGTGIAKGVSWHDIEISRSDWSAPQIKLSGQALSYFKAKTPAGMDGHIHLTMTDEWPYAQAFVILSATPSTSKGN